MTTRTLRDAIPYKPEGPTPIVRQDTPGEPYPTDALGPLKDVATALHDIVQAPIEICAQSTLGAAALAAQALGDAETLRSRAPSSLFLFTEAASGERKSTCDALAMKAVDEYEAELADEHRRQALRLSE